MPAHRRRALLAVTTALLTGTALAAVTLTAPAVAATGSAAGPAVTPTASVTPSPDRGVIVEVPRTAPATLDLFRVFRRGTTFSVSLYENGTTGYLWSATQSPGSERVVTYLDTDFVQDPAAPGMAGVGGTRYFRYVGQHRGAATLTFRYQRSWEPEPIAVVTLRVVIR